MKYILLISMLFSAFSPRAICTNDMKCCDGNEDMSQMELHIMTMDDAVDEVHDWCSMSKENQSEKDNENTTIPSHACDCFMIFTSLIVNDQGLYPPPGITENINTDVEQLSSIIAFSIWIPPNTVA